MSGLDLRTREGMLKGGERGPAVVPGQSDKSRLYRFSAGLDKPQMPPGKTLSDAELKVLRQWIDTGAPLEAKREPGEADKAALAKLEERPITAAEKSYWAFRPVVRSAVPLEAKNPVDGFLLAAMQSKGLKPGPRASRRALIRRAYLDLWGMPPTPEAVERFLADQSPDAFSKVVEELLASPNYGERWARHWLDIVRYADSSGFEFDTNKPNIWRYRDYVIDAFNHDKPYDRFLREQLAGDEIDPDSREAVIATGYLRLGLENNIKNEMTKLDELDDIVSTTTGALLGMTVGCARCHNHKFDPIPQKDYYQIQAVFFPSKPSEYKLAPKDQLATYNAEIKRIDGLVAPLKRQIAEVEKPYREKIVADKRSKLPAYLITALQTPAEKRTEGQRLNVIQVQKSLVADENELKVALSAAVLERRTEIQKKMAALEATKPPAPPAALTVREDGPKAPESHFLHRGSAGSPGSVMQPGVLTAASWQEWQFPAPPANAKTSWRRRGFAEWVASPENPLTTRVMVNRIWQQHFGEGIVRTPNNFGKMGEPPTHPELLDWLASEFVRTGWSVKSMHRLLLNSEAYQRASDDIAMDSKIDNENRYLWRMPRRRVEAEVIRDSMLAVAGNLVTERGGPAVFPYIDPSLFQASSARTWPGKPDTDPSTWRRSIYVFTKRSIPLPMLDIFDKPDSVSSCARRNRSTIAPQSLIMMNNAFVALEAVKFAERLKELAGDRPEAQVDRAFELALSRHPSQSEATRAVDFIKSDVDGLVDFCKAIFNLNEFVYFP
jgi:hypothetical protein